MEPEVSLFSSQESSTGPNPKSDKTSPYHPINIITCWWLVTGFGLVIWFVEHL
jgi:hypothetical protein